MARTFTHIADPHFAQKSKEAENGGSGLPPVTEDDNDKMLQVVNGQWKVKDYPTEDNITYLFNETITITDSNVEIPFSVGTDLSHPETWTVNVDNKTLEYDATGPAFILTDAGLHYEVVFYQDVWYLSVSDDNTSVIEAGDYALSIFEGEITTDTNFVRAVEDIIGLETITFTYDGDIQGYISNKSTKHIFDLLSEGHLFLAKVYHGSPTTYCLGYVFAEIDNTNIGALFICDVGHYIQTYPTSIETSVYEWYIST